MAHLLHLIKLIKDIFFAVILKRNKEFFKKNFLNIIKKGSERDY